MSVLYQSRRIGFITPTGVFSKIIRILSGELLSQKGCLKYIEV